MLQKEVKFQQVTQPEVIKNKEGQTVTTKDNKELKKAQVITSYDVQQNNKNVTKGLVANIIGVDTYIGKTQNYINNNFQKDDNCILSFEVESKKSKNKTFFTNIKFVRIEHANKQQTDINNSNNISDDKDDLPF